MIPSISYLLGTVEMDLGLSRILEKIEEVCGKRVARALVWLICLALTVWAARLVITDGAIPIYEFLAGVAAKYGSSVEDMIGGVWSSTRDFVPLIATAISLAAVAAVLNQIIASVLTEYRRRATRVNELARLRAEAITDILNGHVQSDADLASWQQQSDDWLRRVENHLKAHFEEADYLAFHLLGVIRTELWDHAYNVEHARQLNFLARRLAILEELIARYSRR